MWSKSLVFLTLLYALTPHITHSSMDIFSLRCQLTFPFFPDTLWLCRVIVSDKFRQCRRRTSCGWGYWFDKFRLKFDKILFWFVLIRWAAGGEDCLSGENEINSLERLTHACFVILFNEVLDLNQQIFTYRLLIYKGC